MLKNVDVYDKYGNPQWFRLRTNAVARVAAARKALRDGGWTIKQSAAEAVVNAQEGVGYIQGDNLVPRNFDFGRLDRNDPVREPT